VKVFFLILMVATSPDDYVKVKIPFGYTLIPITCDEAFEKNVIFKDTETYFKNRIVMAHYCLDEQNNYYMGYEEKLNWELGH